MDKKVINSAAAPPPIGPYSQAVKAGDMYFISGQIALKPGSSEVVTGSITDETKQVMNNLKAILDSAGLSFSNVIKTTIFLSDMALFGQVNEMYGSYFESEYPARETIAVKGLPKNVNVEISMIACE